MVFINVHFMFKIELAAVKVWSHFLEEMPKKDGEVAFFMTM